MRTGLRKWWPVLKLVFGLAIVAAIGWRFARDLRNPALWYRSDLRDVGASMAGLGASPGGTGPWAAAAAWQAGTTRRSFHFGWLAISGVLYIVALGFSALFWYRLLLGLGQRPAVPAAIRAYYLGHLGKYLPGKAWALLLRATLIRGPGVSLGVAGITSLYEVLTTMASGVLLAALLFALLLPDVPSSGPAPILHLLWQMLTGHPPAALPPPDRRGLILLSLILFAGVGWPLLPRLFNRVIHRLASMRPVAREAEEGSGPILPRLRLAFLPQGLALTACGWALLGLSLWATLQAVLGRSLPWSWEGWGRYTAFMGLAYVAGFVILVVPSGFGVREIFLALLLIPELAQQGLRPAEAQGIAALTVLLLRLVWTAAEVVMVGVVYRLPRPAPEKVEDQVPRP